MMVESPGVKFVQRSPSPRPLPPGEGEPSHTWGHPKVNESLAVQGDFWQETSLRSKAFVGPGCRVVFSLSWGRGPTPSLAGAGEGGRRPGEG